MPNFKYRYLWNSYLGHDAISANQSPSHFPTLDGYLPGDPLIMAFEGEITVEVYGHERSCQLNVCEQLFKLFNAPWERPNIYAGPSLSKGDVIILFPDTEEQVEFACVTSGFVEVDATASKVSERPENWLRSDPAKMREYLMAKGEDVTLTEDEEAYLYGEPPTVDTTFVRDNG